MSALPVFTVLLLKLAHPSMRLPPTSVLTACGAPHKPVAQAALSTRGARPQCVYHQTHDDRSQPTEIAAHKPSSAGRQLETGCGP
jgi:hypothetical protein